VFEMFTRLHNRRQHDGSGLGLSICQRIVDLHQGRLTLDSRPGEGSRFTLHLPITDTP
jgi:signal transduction histidine kinase